MDTPQPVTPYRKRVSGRTQLTLWLMLAPTCMIALSLMLFAVLNLIFNPTFWPTPDTADFNVISFAITLFNIVLLVIGAFGVLAWLPGLVIGIILLITRKETR